MENKIEARHLNLYYGQKHALKDVSLDIQRMNALLRTYGIETDSPITRPSTLALIVIPEVKMSDLGLIDVVNQKVIKQF